MYYVVLGLLCESITSYFYNMKYFVKNIFKGKKKQTQISDSNGSVSLRV